MNWESLDWEVLDRLRETFLSEARREGSYWHTLTDLECYDFTYAQRIGWKWDAVLNEVRRRDLVVPSGATILDWGCGSGVAGRRVVDFLGAGNIARLLLHDQSALAVDYALHRARRLHPALPAERATVRELAGEAQVDVLVLSHVVNELDPAAQVQLEQLVRRAGTVLWVEPGTHETSRLLGSWRERLRRDFHLLAPCPHAGPCGILGPGNERHWCHFFAAPPPAIFSDSNWVRFGLRAGIDLRSLPYSYLVLQHRPGPATAPRTARIIGEPRFYKGYARLFICADSGVHEATLQKRDAPELFKQLKRGGATGHLWKVADGRLLPAKPE